MKKLTYILEILLISGLFASPVFGAQSFAGFSANNNLGSQIADGLIQNMVNVTLEETSAGKYSINIVNVAECSFTMGGVTFWFTPTQAGQTAYKTYNNYIQPNGNNREIRIPTVVGEQVKIVLMEDCDDVLVNGVSQALSAGDNILTATDDSIVLRTQNGYKSKISSIVSLAEGEEPETETEPAAEDINDFSSLVFEPREGYGRWAEVLMYGIHNIGSTDCTCGAAIGGGLYYYSSRLNIVAIPATGYVFDHWENTQEEQNPITSDHGYYTSSSIKAVFRPIEESKTLNISDSIYNYKRNTGDVQKAGLLPSSFIVYGWKNKRKE